MLLMHNEMMIMLMRWNVNACLTPRCYTPLIFEIQRCSVRASATVRFLIVFLATKECKRGATSIMRCPCSHLSSQKSAANWISYTDFAEYSPRVFYFQFKTFYHLDVMLLKINKIFLCKKYYFLYYMDVAPKTCHLIF